VSERAPDRCGRSAQQGVMRARPTDGTRARPRRAEGCSCGDRYASKQKKKKKKQKKY